MKLFVFTLKRTILGILFVYVSITNLLAVSSKQTTVLPIEPISQQEQIFKQIVIINASKEGPVDFAIEEITSAGKESD